MGRQVVIAALVGALPACLIDVDYSNTRFRCSTSDDCPAPYACVEGFCQESGSVAADAMVPPDATVDARAIDAGPTLFQRRVLSGADDSEELISADPAIDGNIDRGSTDLELGDNGQQIAGARFVAIDLEQGLELVSASIQFTADEISTGATTVEIRAEAADNAAPLTTNNGDLSSRATTGAAVIWEPAAWETLGEAGPDQRSPDLAPVLAEVLDRPGWTPGNAVVFLITGTGVRFAESFNGDPDLAPLLLVEYRD